MAVSAPRMCVRRCYARFLLTLRLLHDDTEEKPLVRLQQALHMAVSAPRMCLLEGVTLNFLPTLRLQLRLLTTALRQEEA